jgi:lipopolysaccharide transport system ATP-binding protein
LNVGGGGGQTARPHRGDAAIEVRGLGKAYTIAHNAVRHTTMAEALLHSVRNPTLRRQTSEEFWSLKDVSFDIYPGDVVGVIGRNGAGKSTLLKVLSRITEPTEGRVKLVGRVGSLLEVGTGFHPELTGRENIFLNGAVLGMTRREIDRQFDAIVDFSGTEKFLDTPVKRYSSGMYVRLAFAVAAHLNPEILIIDEVLAVGDAEFQRKCLGKMHEVASGGERTVLFVSHNMQSVSLLCNRALYLQNGSVHFDGSVDGAVKLYLDSFHQKNEADARPDLRPGAGDSRFVMVEPDKQVFEPDEPKVIHWEIARRRGNMAGMYVAAHVVDQHGTTIAQCDSRLVNFLLSDGDSATGQLVLRNPWLKPGDYRVDLFICALGVGIVDRFDGATTFTVSPVLPYPNSASEEAAAFGLVLSDFAWHNTK